MKFSIIMCAKNSMPYILSSIESFRKQSFINKELIIVFSNSEDETKEYLKNIKDKNIKIFNYEGSIYSCLNFGITKAKGELIGILHSDDIFFSEDTLYKIAQVYKTNKCDIIYGDVAYSNKNNLLDIKRTWTNINLENKFDLPPHTGTFIHKKIYKRFKYNKNFSISGDTDYLINILKNNFHKFYIKNYITIMREGGASTIYSNFFRKFNEDIYIFKKYKLSILDYFRKIFSKLGQVIFVKEVKISKYHKKINEFSNIEFINLNDLNKYKGKIICALNLAFLSYNYKYRLRSHSYLFWADGIFSTYLLNKKKIPGRKFLKKFIKLINKKKLYDKIYIIGNLPKKSNDWLEKKLISTFIHIDMPFGKITKLKKKVQNLKFSKNSLIIMTLPTPRQEIIGSHILKKNSSCNILCVGGAINMLSGYENRIPSYMNYLNLEWLWRLRFDTKRRLKRLIESGLIFAKISILNKNNIS